MNNKVIKHAEIVFIRKPNDGSLTIDCDVDFALSLRTGDMIWLGDDSEAEDYPYLNMTTEELKEFAGDIYVITQRILLSRGQLHIIIEEVRGGGSVYLEKFAHLQF